MRHLLLLCLLPLFSSHKPSSATVQVRPVVRGLTAPVYLTAPADGSRRLFIVEQTGTIRVVKDGKLLQQPFLDIGKKLDKLNSGYSEKGLLGLAFHPQYKTNGRFFVYYSAPARSNREDHHSVLAEFHAEGIADVADAESERRLMTISQPESNHNGGQLAFGPDGFLYIGLGDGGGAGDKHGTSGNGQNTATVLGKILRIDVNGRKPYDIPADNPFANADGAKKEIYASGLRNPWRFSFDRKDGQLLCADVGQNQYEELNIIERGGNYGWRIMEGKHCYGTARCKTDGFKFPLLEYNHDEGICIVGGYVYRGKSGKYTGNYFFGDWTGKFWRIESTQSDTMIPVVLVAGEAPVKGSLNSFGEDEEGNLYVLMQMSTGPESSTGVVWQLLL